ncbi:dephospho-CoA kinase [Halobacillus salinarum]|uniref:Dephospho-CoA kinase n=1 Tax=Halobacillus salinarum TaxID=2932257 RepID=A0ABY4EPP9_9BACI|nr:dephospho-CoA kinase [Halobacillus salinarum]UOQ46434.1 dephospho-CoA kinase [Halobacillus salinarum]
MSVVIGLTGSIASGKSTISKMFKDFNIPVIDADIISREVVEPGKPAYRKIVETFGETILNAERTLDRKRLGSIIFNDYEKRKQLNEIVHPEVRKQMTDQRDELKKQHKAVVLDIPLLFESGLQHFVDQVLLVYVDKETQVKRLMERDQSSLEEAEQRIKAQMSLDEKAGLADAVIDNNGPVDASFRQLKQILRNWDVIQ